MNIKSKALLAYVAIFLLGGASGFFLNEALSPDYRTDGFERGRGMNKERPFPNRGEVPDRMRQFLINRLDLQEEQIEPFFEVQAQHLREIFSAVDEHRDEEMEMLRQKYSDFIEDVDSILSEEQIEKLNSFAHPDSVHQRRTERRHQRRFR